MTDEQINEVMRLVGDVVIANALFVTGQVLDTTLIGEAHYTLNACLRTIEPTQNTFPLNPNAASKWAHLQKHDGAEAIGVVFRTGSRSVGSLVDGRVVWADWLAHPTVSKPESVNAELLEALKSAKNGLEWYQDAHPESASECDSEAMQDLDAAIARAESAIESSPKPATFPAMRAAFRTTRVVAGEFIMAFKFRDIEDMDRADDEWRAAMAIETPANVGPCAGHAVQQEAELRQIVGIKEAIAGIHEFFDSECHSGITGIVDTSKVCGDRIEDECRPTFDHCYVNQGGGGITGYDFHGTVYFHIGNGEYATVDY